MIECDSTSITETYYNGNGCDTSPISSEVIISTGCDDDFSHLSQQFPNRQAYTEIIYCPTAGNLLFIYSCILAHNYNSIFI